MARTRDADATPGIYKALMPGVNDSNSPNELGCQRGHIGGTPSLGGGSSSTDLSCSLSACKRAFSFSNCPILASNCATRSPSPLHAHVAAALPPLHAPPHTVGGVAAAGAYQFMPDTWKAISTKLGLKGGMTPANQDLAALGLMADRGVDPKQGWSEEALYKLAPEWASFPKDRSGVSYYNQPVKKMEKMKQLYEQLLAEERSRLQ